MFVRRSACAVSKTLAIAVAAACLSAMAANAADCGNGAGGFDNWLDKFKGKAQAAGISAGTINAALAGVAYDANVVRLDRSQKSFKLSFASFYARRVSGSLISRARQKMASNAALLGSIEKRFGVPPEIIVSIWGLETNFGGDGHGGKSIIRSVATLAYDCRRSGFFQNELMSALKIIDHDDMSVAQMRGGWAGEIGPFQFLPSSFIKYGVDFDGNGRRNLQSSTADMLASAANLLKANGWQAGGGYGPGSANANVLREWNRAEVYVKTISVMAGKVRGGG